MAKIGFILFADDFSNDVRGKIGEGVYIRNPRLTLTPAFVPGQFSFATLFGLYDLNDGQSYKIHMKLSHKETQEVSFETDFEFVFALTQEARQIGDKTTIGNIQLNNIKFTKPGAYNFRITVDGEPTDQVLFVYPEPNGA